MVSNMITKFSNMNTNEDLGKIDQEICDNLNVYDDVDELVDNVFSCITAACNTTFKISNRARHVIKKNNVPWWTEELTVLRKRTNALRRRFQRTTNNDTLRQERKAQYSEGKHEYERKLKDAKFKSWKTFCTIKDGANPWTAVYKIASGKIRTSTKLTTIEKNDGTYTTDMKTTLTHMLTHFAPDDRADSDNHYHKKVRKDCQDPTTTVDDKPFTQEEIIANLKKFNPKKTPGEDGLTSDILIRAFQVFPLVFTRIYNACLQRGCFPKRWKCSIIIPVIKPGKETCNDASKYRPISLLNTGGKLLERMLIDRILFHMHSNNLFNNNQYGFTPQRGTVEAAMVAKNFIEESLRLKQCTVIVSLDVKGAFDAAWWPSILKQLKEFKCPANLYRLSVSYFSNRRAKLTINNYTIEKEVQKGCPQGSCCGPGYWNIMYNSLLNLKFSSRTKVVAFADDLIVLTRGTSTIEAENYANYDLKKIERWAADNKMEFNDKKSQVLLISRKRNDDKNVNIYLNYKKLDQTNELKYLGIYLDSKFNFNAHIDHTTDKLIKLINMLARTAKLQWGLGHKALKVIYEGAIVPILTYGAPIWVEVIRKSRNLAKYKRIQRLINIKIAKAYRTISYDASCVIAGEPPIEILIGQKVQTYVNMSRAPDSCFLKSRYLELVWLYLYAVTYFPPEFSDAIRLRS